MTAGPGPNEFWQSVLERFPEHTALVSVDGQNISFAKLDRAIGNIADLLADYGAMPGAKIACAIPNFAVTVASWFATWRIGCHVMTAPDPGLFEAFGLTPDFVLVAAGGTSAVGASIPLHPNALTDEPGEQFIAPAGKTFFHTANTPRDSRAMAVRPEQLIRDGQLYTDLLGPPAGGVYMTTGLSSLRAMRDVFRAFEAGVHVVGGDVSPDRIWPLIADKSLRELMLSPFSLHAVLKNAPETPIHHAIEQIFIGAGTPQVDLLKRAYAVFGDVIGLGAGTNETSVYAWKKYCPTSHEAGEIGPTRCGIVGEIRGLDGRPAPPGEVGQLALWVPPEQRFEGYINSNPAYDAEGWVFPGFLATMSPDGSFTKLGRTDDRINLGGTRLFSGKVETQLERLPSVTRAVAIRVFADDGAEALGIAVEPGPQFDPTALLATLQRSLRGIGEIIIKTMENLPMAPNGQPDRNAVEDAWSNLPNATGQT